MCAIVDAAVSWPLFDVACMFLNPLKRGPTGLTHILLLVDFVYRAT